MGRDSAKLILHSSSGWLSGMVGAGTIACRTRLGGTVRAILRPGTYQISESAAEQAARGIIAILRSGERAIIIEGGNSASGARAFVVEGGRGANGSRSIIIEGGRSASTRGFVIEGGRQAGADNAIIVEGGLDWLPALTSGTLDVVG